MDPSAQGVSPCGRYVVNTRSRVDQVPVSQLLDCRTGNNTVLETADVSGLPGNWQWPQPVMAKAADGETDLYAVIFRPTDFDPQKLYPVVDCTFGAFTPVGSFTNSSLNYYSAAAYAELGAIVVMVNQRGGGLRGSEFKQYQDPALAVHPMAVTQYGKTDCIAVIKQLAMQYPYMDINRVGIAEFGSVPSALSGLLLHADFYKVGVSMTPKTDWRMMGALGMDDGDYPVLDQFAENLAGKLLIITGMLDDVMTVSMTFRFIEALRQANKTFDMLMMPTLGHGRTGYEIRRAWDYLVEHLLGEKPPSDFKLTTGIDLMRSGKADD